MEKSSFFDSDVINGQYDRVYSAEDFASYFNTVLTTGIFPSPSTNLQVVANNNMTVTVKSGDAFINGYMYHNTDDLTLELNTADGVLKRIDLVVVRLDHVNREIKCHIKTGTFGSSPVKPSLTRNEEIYELCLAEINIGNGIISVNQDSIIDTRYNSSVCGIVNSLIEIDTEEIYSQMRGLIEQREEEFFKWFNDLKANLDGNVATNLQGQINVLEDDVLINNTSEDLLNEDVTSFKVGTGTVEGIRKDYTEEMQSCLVCLNDINGKTEKINTSFESVSLNQISTVLSEEFTNVYNLVLTRNFKPYNVSQANAIGDSIRITSANPGGAYLSFEDIQLTPNTEYIAVMDAENLGGTPSINIWIGNTNIGNLVKKDINDYMDYNEGIMQNTLYFRTDSTGKVKAYFYCNKFENFQAGKTAQFNSVKFYKVKRHLNLGRDLFLRSLPDGITKDSYSNGKIIKRVGYFVLDSNTQLTQVENSGEFKQFYVKLPNCKEGINININDFEFAGGSSDWSKQSSISASAYNDQCLSISTDGCLYIKTITDSHPSFMNWLGKNITYIIYPLDVPEVISLDTSILCDKTDLIFIDSFLQTNCTHKVSLNTKSQVEELQEVVYKEKKSILQKVKDLLSVKYNIDTISYFVFPSLFGSLKVQWGHIHISGGTPGGEFSVTFPISFSKKYSLQLTTEGANAYEVDVNKLNGAFNRSNNGFNFSLSKTYDGVGVSVLWFAFGV